MNERNGPAMRWAHLSDDDLKAMLRDVLASGPEMQDGEFLRDLAHEIARRAKAGGAA